MALPEPDADARRRERAGASGFSLMELIVALSVLAVVIGAFSALLRSAMDYERALLHETKGLVVLNNVVERLGVATNVNPALAGQILTEEFQRSDLARESGLSPDCQAQAGKTCLTIRKRNGRPLVTVELGGPG